MVAMMQLSMPGEYEVHERTLMCWPTRDEIWGRHRRQAELDYASIAQTISAFEPVTMVAGADRASTAADMCGAGQVHPIDVVELPLNDSWARDTAPIYVRDSSGRRVAVDFTFNSWGHKFHPYDDDAAFADRWAARQQLPTVSIPMVFEGGSVTVDGAGTVVTTEQCLLHPNRNPGMTRRAIEDTLRSTLGVSTVIWVPYGLAMDDDTDGHVDNVAAFARPGTLLLQGCSDPAEADFDRLAIDRRCVQDAIDGRGLPIDVAWVPELAFTELDGERLVVPYLNLYIVNGGVIVPVSGHPADADMLALIGEQFPDRTIAPVPGTMLAKGGGGPHCITQQVIPG
jgi:agmatine deiminase